MEVCSTNRTAFNPLWASSEGKSMEAVRDTLIGVGYAANLLFGLPTNGYVLWLRMRGNQKKIASDFIPLNQIVAEILLCLSGFWYFPSHYLSLCLFKKQFQLLSAMFLIMRPLVQSYICLEQYLATVHPVLFLRCKPLRYRVACYCVSWLIVIAVSTTGMVFDLHSWFFLMIAPLYHFFWLLMAFCCFSVLRALKHPGPGEGQRDQRRANSMKKRAFKIILINLVYTTLYQLPMAVVASLIGTIPSIQVFTVASVNVCIFVVTGFVPPMLYLYRVGKLHSKCSCL